MKISTKLVTRLTVLCGAVFLATTTFALGSDASEAGMLTIENNNSVNIESDLDQVDPLEMSVSLSSYNGVNIRCYGQNSGSATCTSTGGVSPYTYSWSHNGALTGNSSAGMAAGSYSVTVTDAAGASVTQSYSLIQNPPMAAGVNVSEIQCYGGTASVSTFATGGTAPYVGVTTYENVTPGFYIYNLIDANGCRSGTSVTITQPDIIEASATPTAILCHGDLSAVTVDATGGTLPLSGVGVFNVTAGVYEYIVTDANGCTDEIEVAVNQPGVLSTSATNTEILCYGLTSTVTITAASGQEPYNGTGSFTETAGTKVYTVVDYNGCASTVTVEIDQPDLMVPVATATPIDCNGGTSTITVNGTGGTGPYAGGVGTYVVPAGTYTYDVWDSNACASTVSVVVSEPEAVAATLTSTAITCNGGTSDVTISATGGTSLYTGTGTFPTGAGTHTFTVTDGNGCSADVTTTLTQPSAIVVSAAASGTITCANQSTNVVVSATGGSAPYTGTGTIFNVSAGTNTYTVTDANGCSASKNYTVAGPDQIVANISPAIQTIDCIPAPVTFQAYPNGGVAPYSYAWSNGSTSSSITVNPNVTTVYELTITDANGCSVTTTNGATLLVMNRCGNNNQKIVICHVPSGNGENPQTICISPNALDPHMLNAWNLHGGDYCGPCQSTMSLTLDEENNGDNNFVSVGFNTNNETVEVSYRIAYDTDVRLEIYDMTGALVEMIHQSNANEGQLYEFALSPSKFTTGVYIYQFVTNTERHIDKLHFIH